MSQKKTEERPTEMTRPMVEEIRRKLEAALVHVELPYVDVRVGRGTYTNTTLTLKVEAALMGGDGNVETKEAKAFREYAALEDMEANWLFTNVTLNREQFKIVGYRARARKYPVLAQKLSTGKRYCFPVDSIKRAVKFRELQAATGGAGQPS